MTVPQSDTTADPDAAIRAASASAFAITSAAALQLRAVLTKRVLGFRATSAVLLVATLLAIAGGIALIFYAGELATRQHSADVDSLLEADTKVRSQIAEIVKEAESQIARLRSAEDDVAYYQNQLSQAQTDLKQETEGSDKYKGLQAQIKEMEDRIRKEPHRFQSSSQK